MPLETFEGVTGNSEIACGVQPFVRTLCIVAVASSLVTVTTGCNRASAHRSAGKDERLDSDIPRRHHTILPAVLLFQVKPEAPIKTSICELVRDPDRFNGKVVQVRGAVVSGMETGGLRDASCSAFVLVDSFDPLFSGLKGQAAFIRSLDDLKNPESLIWKPLAALRSVDLDENASYVDLMRYLKKAKRKDGSVCFHCPLYEVTATMTGRFDHLETHMVAVRAGPGAKVETYYAGFGHLSAALSRLVPQFVSNMVARPIDPSVYEHEQR